MKPEKYKPIGTLYKDDEGNRWTYHLFKYGKNNACYWTA